MGNMLTLMRYAECDTNIHNARACWWQKIKANITIVYICMSFVHENPTVESEEKLWKIMSHATINVFFSSTDWNNMISRVVRITYIWELLGWIKCNFSIRNKTSSWHHHNSSCEHTSSHFFNPSYSSFSSPFAFPSPFSASPYTSSHVVVVVVISIVCRLQLNILYCV